MSNPFRDLAGDSQGTGLASSAEAETGAQCQAQGSDGFGPGTDGVYMFSCQKYGGLSIGPFGMSVADSTNCPHKKQWTRAAFHVLFGNLRQPLQGVDWWWV